MAEPTWPTTIPAPTGAKASNREALFVKRTGVPARATDGAGTYENLSFSIETEFAEANPQLFDRIRVPTTAAPTLSYELIADPRDPKGNMQIAAALAKNAADKVMYWVYEDSQGILFWGSGYAALSGEMRTDPTGIKAYPIEIGIVAWDFMLPTVTV